MTRFPLRFWMCGESAALSRSIAISFSTAGSRSSVYRADSASSELLQIPRQALLAFHSESLFLGYACITRQPNLGGPAATGCITPKPRIEVGFDSCREIPFTPPNARDVSIKDASQA